MSSLLPQPQQAFAVVQTAEEDGEGEGAHGREHEECVEGRTQQVFHRSPARTHMHACDDVCVSCHVMSSCHRGDSRWKGQGDSGCENG